jgi:hypothetical protein
MLVALTPANLRGNGKIDLIVVDPDDVGPHGGARENRNQSRSWRRRMIGHPCSVPTLVDFAIVLQSPLVDFFTASSPRFRLVAQRHFHMLLIVVSYSECGHKVSHHSPDGGRRILKIGPVQMWRNTMKSNVRNERVVVIEVVLKHF